MSVDAISWALNLAPVPADRGGQPSSACKFVLVGLGQPRRAGRHGRVLSVATLVRYTGLAERTVRACLDRLQTAGIIAPCDPGVVAARISAPADWRRPARSWWGWLRGGAGSATGSGFAGRLRFGRRRNRAG